MKHSSQFKSIVLGAVFALFMLFTPAALGADQLKVHLIHRGRVKEFKAQGLIQAPIDKVWQVLTHYEHYPQFMPRVVSSKLNLRKNNLSIVTVKLKLPFPLSGVWYTNKYTLDPKRYFFKWTMLKGSLKSSQGSWQLVAKGKATFATYQIRAEPKIKLVPQWLIHRATRVTFPAIFKAVEKRAQGLGSSTKATK